MADLEGEKRSFLERMQESFRLVIYRADDFRELRAVDLNLGIIYITVSIVSLILLGGFFALFTFTPLKRMIPGYGKIEANQQFIELIESVDELSDQIDAQQTYLNAFGKLMTVASDMPGEENSNVEPVQIKQAVKASPPVRSTQPAVMSDSSGQTVVEVQPTIDAYDLYTTLRESDFVRPVDGVISSRYSPEISHYGIDILAPKNTPVKAMMDGFVFSSGWDLETGYTIGVQHEGNILSFYKHNSILLKEKGTFVRAGEALAIIGNTGTLSSGPHLHFELWHSGKPVNPEEFINFN